jgi:LmbE family N-acetylglucosaminyl deacetylase
MKRARIAAACLAPLFFAIAAAAAPAPVAPPLFPGIKSVLWIGAHPDDEVFISPLLGHLCLDEHLKCSLLVATRGEAGHCLLPDGCRPDLATVRSAEMAKAAKLLKARLTLWDLADGGAAADGSAGAWDAASGGHEALLAVLAAHIAATQADLVITFDPRHGSTCHSDHRAIGRLVVEAVARVASRPLLYFVENRLEERASPFTVALPAAAPAKAGAFAFDANLLLSSTHQAAWQILLQDLEAHPSQFDARLRRAVRAIGPRGRAVFLGPAQLLLSSSAVADCGQ